jgi:cysteine desulfurase NifS
MCTIGRHSPQVVHDPDRLKTPLRRKGPKGGYDFEVISWDDAFDIIVNQLEKTKAERGAEATAVYTGRGAFDQALCDLFQPAGIAVSSASSVLFPFGSPNTLGVGALCYVSFAIIAPHTTLGELYLTMDADIERAELVVLWGANPATDSPPLGHHQILQARARGADVVAIDPRRQATARQAEALWLGIRPGTDGALALSMIQVLIEEELYDEAFVRDWTVGFDELAQLCQHYRPEAAAAITGLPANQIRGLARRLAAARGACPVMYTGLEYSDSGVQAIRAVLILWALAGQLDVPGGLVIAMRENAFPQNRSRLQTNPDPARALGRDRFPLYSLYRGESHAIALPQAVLEGRPYPITTLLIQGGSLITSWPDPELWRRTLAALDFLVCIDRYHTADSAYADLVLPATTGYENLSYMRYGGLFKIRERMVAPQGQARNDLLIMAQLAQRLGYGELYPQSEEEVLHVALEGTDFTVDQVRAAGGAVRIPAVTQEYRKWQKGRLRPDGQPGFNTPSGRLEIASSILAEHGYDPLPVYTEPREGPLAAPTLAERFPLVMGSGTRSRFDFRSQHHNVEGLREAQPNPTVLLHVDDARKRGIGEGDPIWVDTARGRAPYRAQLTKDILRGCVDAQMGGGGPNGPESWRQCNVNILTDPARFDPISGFPIYKTLLCDVRRAQGEAVTSPAVEDGPERPRTASTVPPPRVYLDYNATTPVEPEVVEAMTPWLAAAGCGNPSSIHTPGLRARAAVEGARRQVAHVLGCTARRIIFTASGSEANNLAIKGALAHLPGGHLICSAVEHPAVRATCEALAGAGYELTLLPVDSQGLVSPSALKSALRSDTRLVSVMAANNEVGTVQPIRELAALVRDHGVLFHCDAVQALGKLPVDVEALGVDLLSLSAHKVGGPKGVGALYRRQGVHLTPLVHGGAQEGGLRAGTENVPAIVGFGVACALAEQRLLAGEAERLQRLRERLVAGLLEQFPKAGINSHRSQCLPNTLNVSLPGIRGESIVLLLDRQGISLSSGSACKSGHPAPSPTLMAMGLNAEQAHCAVRFSLGSTTTETDIDIALAAVGRVKRESMEALRFVGCR